MQQPMFTSSSPLPTSGTQRFEGRIAFEHAVRLALHEAAQQGARQIWMVDPDYDDWPLGEHAVVDDLSHWAASSHLGRCTLVAANFERFVSQPRWVQWRKTWAHKVTCLQAPDEWLLRLPSLFFVPGLIAIERLDFEHHRGTVSFDPSRWAACQEACDAISQRSSEGFPVTTLGL
jgi:hypothetical protein